MPWSPAGTIILKTDWQYSEPVTGEYFRLKHTSAPLNSSFLIAQAQFNTDNSVELFSIQEFKASDEYFDIYLKKPGIFTDRRIAIKRLSKQSSLASELRRVIRNDLLEDDFESPARRSIWSVEIDASDYVEAVATGGETTTPPPPPSSGTLLNWVTDGDTNGLFYYLGTNKLTQAFVNPALSSVAITASSILNNDSTYAPSNLTDRTSSIYHSEGVINTNSVTVDLGASRTLVLSHYSWKGRGDANSNHQRHWKFQGSIDNIQWDDLDVQTSFNELNQNTWFSKGIVSQTVKYRYFRFMQTNINSSNNNHLNGQELELYGNLFEAP